MAIPTLSGAPTPGPPPTTPPRRKGSASRRGRGEASGDPAPARHRVDLSAARDLGRRVGDTGRRLWAAASGRSLPWLRTAAAWLVRHLGPTVQRAGRALAPVSTLGWIALGAGVGSLVVGMALGWQETVAVGVVLLVLLLAAVAWVARGAAYEAEIRLSSTRVRIGQDALGSVQVHNRTARSLPPGAVDLPVGRAVATFPVPRLGTTATDEHVFRVPARHRGVVTIGPVHTVRSDPFGLLRRDTACSDRVVLHIHPRVVRLEAGTLGFLKDVEGVPTQTLSSSDVSFHALRDYVRGDDRRNIHWRTTARVGRLMVRQFEETMRAHLLLVLSLRAEDYASPEDFETAVSTIASLGLAATREERELTVVTSDGQLDTAHGTSLLDALCSVGTRRRAPSLRATAVRGRALAPGASVAAIVSGSLTGAQDLRAARSVLPTQATSFALRCGEGLATARHQAGDLLVLDVQRLDDLGRTMRTVR